MQGKTISGYTLQRPLGTGGMAEVWYAENKIGKNAAVKMLLPKLCQDENVVSRFLTEAKVMVDLNHPNIRQVYDYGDIDGRPAIVMEYLDGSDLKARMKRGQRFTEEELERWWNQLVDALNYTHKKGIVHRDIKPGNIFVNKEGNIKLLDFGIAKVRESISSTQTGQKLGTLMYMSPEQVKDSKHIDYKTDVYSLAVTFVHLLTGKKPYDSDTSSDFEISEKIVYKPLDMSGVPAEWQGFLAPYLEKSPEKRPELRRYEFDEDDATMVDGGESETFETEEGVATSGFAWDPIFGMRQTTAMGNIPSDVDPMPEDESDLNEEETVVEGADQKPKAKTQPAPISKPEQKRPDSSDSEGSQTIDSSEASKSNIKGLWIVIGIAAAVALAVLLMRLKPEPVPYSPSQPTQTIVQEQISTQTTTTSQQTTQTNPTTSTPQIIVPRGAAKGVFSMGSSKQVFFAKGNLQYRAETNEWRFANSQWETLGQANKNISYSNSKWIDLFSWGTGDDPANDSEDNYAYTTFNDWGSYGSGFGDDWRTPTKDEWNYLFTGRYDARNKYGAARVNDVAGIVVLPDDWSLPSGVSFSANMRYSANTYDASSWRKMEDAGAIFLPSAGRRDGRQLYKHGTDGDYWSASSKGTGRAYNIDFVDGKLLPMDDSPTKHGFAVRLVKNK